MTITWGKFASMTVGMVAANLIFIFAVYSRGYQDGQQDALENHWSYQRVLAADGTVKYLELSKPVTMPAGGAP